MVDDGTRYVVVTCDRGLRHIVTYRGYRGASDFLQWYYREYARMPGDRIGVFDTMADAIGYAGELSYAGEGASAQGGKREKEGERK